MERQFRLRHGRDFAHVRSQGRVFQHRLLTLSLAANGLEVNRYGFITSRHLGKAVLRNRVRRLLREAVRLLHPRLERGYDVIIIARKSVIGQPLVVVQQTLSDLLMQAGVLESDVT